MRLIQLLSPDGERQVGVISADAEPPRLVLDTSSVRDLALDARRHGRGLTQEVVVRGLGEAIDYDLAMSDQRVLLPLDHPDPAHLHLSMRRTFRYPCIGRRTPNRQASSYPLNHQDSTTRRQTRILMDVHSGSSAEGWLALQPQLLSPSPNEQPSWQRQLGHH